ncbi:uncharacterized protein METZ01_LOCUS151653 [marine metagenome]|uniref:NIF system FeS cluster assembly NifU C-terminal domain-containing protein n=1 Tax=marine metagenome TaxID=408172 RepID=A0A382ABM5_9ZZZZ
MTDEKTADSLDQTVDAEKTAAEIEIAIATIIEEKLQPSVAMHGGQISLKEWDHANGIATIFMSGACSGCAMSTQTLKMGVENTLKHYIPEVKVVHGEEDINSMVDPYMSKDPWDGYETHNPFNISVKPPEQEPPTSKDNPNSRFNKKD